MLNESWHLMTIGKICLCLVAPPPASTKQLRVSYKGTRSPASWLGLWKYKSMKIHSRLYPPPALLSPPSCISCICCDGIFIPSAYSKSEQCQCQREQPSVKQCKSGDINVYFGLAAHICIIPSHLRCSTTWKMLGASNQKKAQTLAVFRWRCCVAPAVVGDVVVQQLTPPAQHFHKRPLIKNVERQMYPLKSSKAFSPIRAMLPSMNFSSWHSSTLLQAWV